MRIRLQSYLYVHTTSSLPSRTLLLLPLIYSYLMISETTGKWHPEYARYMIESTPSSPFGGTLHDLLKVESDMSSRRTFLNSILAPNERIVSMSCFPFLGVGDFLAIPPSPSSSSSPSDTSEKQKLEPNKSVSKSWYIPDIAIHPHPRFAYFPLLSPLTNCVGP